MINFKGIIKSTSEFGTLTRYINTNSIQRVAEMDANSNYATKIFFNDNASEFSHIPAETWAKAILKADKNDEIVDIDEFQDKNCGSKLNVFG